MRIQLASLAFLALLAGCSSNAGAAHHVYSPCTADSDCPSSLHCVAGVDGGRLCSLECDGTFNCDVVTSSAYCMVRTGNPLGVCVAGCPTPSTSSGEYGCLAEYGIGAHAYPAGSIPACVCTE